jgi:hypothetical protein
MHAFLRVRRFRESQYPILNILRKYFSLNNWRHAYFYPHSLLAAASIDFIHGPPS